MSFKVQRDRVRDNSLTNMAKVGVLESGKRAVSAFSTSPNTIFVGDPLECDGGLIAPTAFSSPSANVVVTDNHSAATFLVTDFNDKVTLDKRLTTSAYGQLIFAFSSGNSVVFDAGEKNDDTFPRILYGYLNNNGTYTEISEVFTKNIEFSGTEAGADASILHWKKFKNGSVFVEAIAGSANATFSLVDK